MYDKGGLLVSVQVDTDSYISDIEYNEKGQRLNIYYGNNTKTKYEYNPLNFRLTRILTTRNTGNDVLQDLNYSYDAVGNIIEQRDDAQQIHYFDNSVIAPTGIYTYDALYRLLSATGRELTNLAIPTYEDFANDNYCPNPVANAMQNYTHYYQYDKLGNMQQMQSQSQWTRNYVYDAVTNRLLKHDLQQTADDYTYDTHGNMLIMPHLSNLAWDYLDQLHGATNGTFTSYYNYDAEGNRSRKVVIKGNIREERYYIGGYEIYRKYNANALDYERTTLNISDDEKVFVRIEQKTGENEVIRYQYDNHLGSACLELDTTGQIISYEEYHPFGTTSYRSGQTETEVSLKRYRYNGKERDEETGLYMYGMRYYAVWICRFVSVDPLQFEYSYYTPYQYAGNKPISFIDLDGLEETDPQKGKKPEAAPSVPPTSGSQLEIEQLRASLPKIEESLIHLVDLQGENKSIDPEGLITAVNNYLDSLGLGFIRMVLAPEGSNFDPSTMNKLDSYAVLGSADVVINFIKEKDPVSYERMGSDLRNLGDSGYAVRPEVASNTGGAYKPKTSAIALEAGVIANKAKDLNIPLMDFAALEVLHGYGHNVGFNHPYELRERYGETKENAAIMITGNQLGTNYKDIMSKRKNYLYIRVIKEYHIKK